MFTKQSFRLPDDWKNFTTKVCEIPLREEQEGVKAIMDKRYKKAHRAVCRSLMAPCQDKFLFRNESSQN